jgi:hypothetical protein
MAMSAECKDVGRLQEVLENPRVAYQKRFLESHLSLWQPVVHTSRRLEDRIRELCAPAIAPNTTNFTDTLAELRSALHEHVEQLRKLARQQLALAKRVAQTPTNGGTAMPVTGDKQQRIMEVVALEGKPHNLTISRESARLERRGTTPDLLTDSR